MDMSGKFKIKKEEVARLAQFRGTVYSNVDEISQLEKDSLWVLEDDALVTCAYGATARGRTSLAKFRVDVTDVKKDADFFFWSLPIDRLVTAAEKIPDDVVDVTVEKHKQRVLFEGSSKKDSAWVTTVKQLEEAEAKEHLFELENLVKDKAPYDTVRVNQGLVDALVAVNSAIKISASTEAISIEKRVVKAADSVIVASVGVDSDAIDGTEVMLGTNTLPLIKALLKTSEFDVKVYRDGPAVVNHVKCISAPIEVAWTNGSFKYEFPTEEELQQVIPLDEKKTVVKVKKADLVGALSKFHGMFDATKWRWQQTYWDWDPTKQSSLSCHYSDLTGEVQTELPVELVSDTDAVAHSMFVPTNYVGVVTKLSKDEELTFTFNSVGEQEPHGIGIVFEGTGVKAVVCKLVKSA